MKISPLSLTFLLTLISCHPGDNPSPQITLPLIATGDLTISPLDQASFKSLVPLGSLNPSSHVFPTDHLYFYLTDKTIEVPVYAPGNLTIIRISQDAGGVGTSTQVNDYSIQLGSDESYLQFGHVARLTDAMISALDFSKGDCQTYTLGNGSVQKNVTCRQKIKVKAGDIIGYSGKAVGQNALDFGMYVNLKPVCPVDYFSEPIKSQLTGRYSSFDGLVKRTLVPLCGNADQNAENTVQGIWLNPGKPKYPESEHIALVHDNIDPTQPAFSIGLSFTGLTSGVYTFEPKATGFINRDFLDVKVDGAVYCYQYRNKGSMVDLPNASIILKLEDSKSLRIERRYCDCSCAPYSFASALSYVKE